MRTGDEGANAVEYRLRIPLITGIITCVITAR